MNEDYKIRKGYKYENVSYYICSYIVRICTYVCMYVRMYVCMYVGMCVHTYTCRHVHTYIRMYAYNQGGNISRVVEVNCSKICGFMAIYSFVVTKQSVKITKLSTSNNLHLWCACIHVCAYLPMYITIYKYICICVHMYVS